MSKLLRYLISNIDKFVIFVSGIILSALVSGLLDKTISNTTAGLVIITVVLAIAAIFFFDQSYQKLNQLAEKSQITAEYVSEPYQTKEYSGTVYRRLQNLIEAAEQEILYLSTGGANPSDEWIKVMQHRARVSFLESIESKIIQKQESGFKYILIRELHNEKVILSSALANHSKFILNKKEESKNKITIDLLKVPTQRMNSFLIIDRKYIVIFLYTDLHGLSLSSGILLVEDREGKMYKKMAWYFNYLERIGRPVSPQELENDIIA